MITNLFVKSPDTKPGKDLIYMKPLDYVLQRVLEWYFDSGKKILDVTAGEQVCWNSIKDNQQLGKNEKVWDVIFCDASSDARTDIVSDFRKLPFKDNSFDIIFFDPPFMKISSGIESIGIKAGRPPCRQFYFRQKEWISPEQQFKDTFKEFNRVSKNGLIVKMSERYENGYEVAVYTEMDLTYDSRYNQESEFKRVSRMYYRGMRKGLGMKTIHPQRVLSSYTIYKKDYKLR